jgi:DNA (cytosine-5)-methyltransferase 1
VVRQAEVTAVASSQVKPLYRVPSMDVVRQLPHNGFTVASTFSGCGGSSLGYRMAGFRVAWASEFIPAAVETYRANASPSTVVDERDIREVTPAQLCEAAGVERGALDILDGSPPCAAFSTAGKRESGWGITKTYSETAQRVDDLFFEYARLVEGVQPRVFVAENVSGLVKGSAKGYFKLILKALRDCGYDVSARLLDASWLGVPQNRQRLIFVGVRRDLGVPPVFPAPVPYRYTVREALPETLGEGDPSRVIHDTSGTFSQGDVTERPCPTVTVGHGGKAGEGGASVNSRHYRVDDRSGRDPVLLDPETGQAITIGKLREECHPRHGGTYRYRGHVRRLTLGEARALCGFPADFVLTGTYAQRWERLGRAVPPVMMAHIAATVRDDILTPLRERGVI